MKGKMIATIFMVTALVGVLGLCGLTLFGSYAYLQANTDGIRLVYNEDTSYEITETQTFPGNGGEFKLTNTIGDVSVEAHASDDIVVEMVKTGWGEDEASAKAAAESIEVAVEQTTDGLEVSFAGEEAAPIQISGSNRANTVDFKVRVPANTPVDLNTTFGKLSLQGTTEGATLTGSFGEVSVADTAGALSISHNQGDLEVRNVKGGENSVLLQTSFGNVTVEGIAGGDVRIATSSGQIDVNGLDASGDITIDNQFGKVELRDFEGEALKITNMSGEVALEDGELSGDLEVETTFGNLEVLSVDASSYALKTQSGALKLDGASGELDIENQFGEINIVNAEGAVLNISNSSGKVSFAGSLDESTTHSVETTFADIILSLPAESALDLSLEARMGKIQSELPVALSGEVDPDNWEGTLNGGGMALRASTESGNIYILELGQ